MYNLSINIKYSGNFWNLAHKWYYKNQPDDRKVCVNVHRYHWLIPYSRRSVSITKKKKKKKIIMTWSAGKSHVLCAVHWETDPVW